MVRVSSAPDSTQVAIAPGKKGLHAYTYPSAIVGPTWLEWEFEVEEYDIDFWVEAAPAAGGQARRLFPAEGDTEGTSIRWEGRRYKAGAPVSEHLELAELGTAAAPMTVKLVFSNQTAWTRERRVKYAVRGWPLVTEQSPSAVRRSAEAEAIHTVASRLADFAARGEQLAESDMRHMLFQPTSQPRDSQRMEVDGPAATTPPTKPRLLLAVASCAPTRSPALRPGYHLDQPYVAVINGLRSWQTATQATLLAVAPEPPVLPPVALEAPRVAEEEEEQQQQQQQQQPTAEPIDLPPPGPPKRKSFIQLVDLVRDELQYEPDLKPREVISTAVEDLGIELDAERGKRGEIEQIATSLGLIAEPEPEPEAEPEEELERQPSFDAAATPEPEPEPEPEPAPQVRPMTPADPPAVEPQPDGQSAEPEPELEPELEPEPEPERELELDETRWFKQNGMEWDRYDATTCRKIEQGYLVYKEHERAWMQQQEAQFEQERAARDTGHRESMSANLTGSGIVQTRDQPKFELPDGSTLDFENMREISTSGRGGQKRVRCRREEPTEEDRNQAKDFRARQSILQEVVVSEVSYFESLEALDAMCFAELRKVPESEMTDACQALSSAFAALLTLHRAVVAQLDGSLAAIASKELLPEEQAIVALKSCIPELKETYAPYLVHWGSATQEVTRVCPQLLGMRVQSKIDGLLSEPLQRLNRYRAFTGKLTQNTADSLPEFEAYKQLSDECEEILLYMVKQPKMGDFQQMRMPISSTQGDTQVPNTVLWLYIDALWGHVQQDAERLATNNGIAMKTFPIDEADTSSVEDQAAKLLQVMGQDSSAVLCVILVYPAAGCPEHVERGIAAVSAAAEAEKIRVLTHEIGEDAKLESADPISRDILKLGHSVMDMRVLQILEKGAVVCEQVFELQQTRFGKWGKPATWPEFCRADGSVSEQPDVRLLPFESGGVWIWLGEWKIQGSDDTDAEGWQYLNGVPRGKALPQEGWARKSGAMTALRRRKHWCFRQRLATTDGYKLESADWTFVRDFQSVVRRLTLMTAESMNKNAGWSEQRTVELQLEAREVVQSIIMTEDGSEERGRGSDEIATWLSERLSTGSPEVAKKTLLIIDGLVDISPAIPDSFRSMLRMRTAAAIREAMATPQTDPGARSVVRISTECHRRFEQVQLPARANCAEADLLRVHKTVQRLENDPLRWELTKREQEFMWNARRKSLLTTSPRMLSVVLLAVPNWDTDAEAAHSLLDVWERLSPSEAIQLLDNRFWRCAQQHLASTGASPTSKVCTEPAKAFAPFRSYAVECLEELDDPLLCSYLLQLALVLRNEDLHDSPLAAYLLRRSLASPFTVGHSFYWNVRAEMAACVTAAKEEGADVVEQYSTFLRLGLLLRTYLDMSGEHRDELLNEELLVDRLRRVVAIGKQTGAGKASESADLMDALAAIDSTLPDVGVRLPIDANKHIGGVIADKCRVMSSATKPLMLNFKKFGHSDEAVGLMFKDGDDLRQDGLCLQVFGLMKRLWEEAGLNVPLTVYKATDLGAEVGMLELVTGAETLSAISVSQRVKGQSNVSAVLDIKKMAMW